MQEWPPGSYAALSRPKGVMKKPYNHCYDRNMMKLRKPEICPICSRSNIKRIVGGIPDEVGMSLIEVGEAVAGDCFMRDWKEDWLCTDCGHRWCDKTDPARIELEELYMQIKNKLEKS
jgi:ribosomal protein L37AE/L43A